MEHSDFIIFFLQLSVLLAVALISGHIARQFKQPAVLGELLGGVILGPTIFGHCAPDLYNYIFKMSSTAAIGREAVVKLGLLFFLFVAGLEMSFLNLRNQGRSVLGVSALGITVPFITGFLAVHCFPSLWGEAVNQHKETFAIFLGTALSISALPVIARILMDINLIQTKLGTVIMSSAMLDDLVGWTLFTIILKDQMHDQSAGATIGTTVSFILIVFIFMLTIGRWTAQKFLIYLRQRSLWPDSFIGIAAVLVLIAAVSAEALGIHAIFGAFLVGVAFAPVSQKRDKTHEVMHQFIANFAAPVYFVSVGLKADFISSFDWALVLIVFLIACLGKIVGVTLGALLGKFSFKESLAIGFAMNARGAMEIVLASVALEHKLIDERIFVALFIMAVGTSMLSAPLIKRFLKGSGYVLN